MGDRGNIIIKDGTDEVYLYTHWTRSRAVNDARRALAKEWRWNDAPYLARIVFDVMTIGEHDQETGFGISSQIGDGDRTVVLDCGAQTVTTHDGHTRTFTEFVAEKGDA